MNRREFVQLSSSAIIGTHFGASSTQAAPISLPSATLGKTQRQVSRLGLGGQGVLETRGALAEKNSEQIIQAALQSGVTYFDTARLYGPSEMYLGKTLGNARRNIFLASKSHAQAKDYDTAMRHLEASLKNLRTDYLDLWQMHMADQDSIADFDTRSGKLRAFIRMKDQGVVKNIGVTGHYDPQRYQELLDVFPFDTALCAFNVADIHHRSFKKALLPTLRSAKLGVICMKVMLKGRLAQQQNISAHAALHYVWSHPIDVAIVGVDSVSQLESNVEALRTFSAMTPAQISRMEKLAKPLAPYLISSCLRRG